MDEMQYLLSDVARIAGIDAGTLRSWQHRGHFWLPAYVVQNGLARLLSQRDARRIAVMAALVRNRVEPKQAGQIAKAFTETNRSVGGRPAGELFQNGPTFVVMNSTAERFQFIAGDPEQTTLRRIIDIVGEPFFSAIELDEIIDRTDVLLSRTPRRKGNPQIGERGQPAAGVRTIRADAD